MDGIFIYKAYRTRNNLAYVPFYDEDEHNPLYQSVDITKFIKKLSTEYISDVICQNNLTNDFVRGALGLDEQELYEGEEDKISVSLLVDLWSFWVS